MDCWSVVDRAHIHFLEPHWDLSEPPILISHLLASSASLNAFATFSTSSTFSTLTSFSTFLSTYIIIFNISIIIVITFSTFSALTSFSAFLSTYIIIFNIIIIVFLCIYVKIKFVELAYDYKNFFLGPKKVKFSFMFFRLLLFSY